jgi:Na+-transporting NADH:ubiquinone oxidoreductase subunit NqrE
MKGQFRRGIFFANNLLNIYMEKRVLGIILSLIGVAGLIIAGVNFMNGNDTRDIKQIVVYGVLGAIFFFAGIGLIRNTRDRPS